MGRMLSVARGASILLVFAGVAAACEEYVPRPANDPASSEDTSPASASTSSSSDDALVAPLAEDRIAPVVPRARSVSLLILEIENLERLAAVMPENDQARPALLRRLGETYAELLLRAMWRDLPASDRVPRLRAATAAAHAWLAKLAAIPEHADWANYVDGLVEEQLGNMGLANAAYARVSGRSKLAALAAQRGSKDARASAPPSVDPHPAAKREPAAAARELLAGGELRVECPLGRHAQSGPEGGCACVSSDDGSAWLPPADARCAGASARAEGDECIFTCGDAGALARDPSGL